MSEQIEIINGSINVTKIQKERFFKGQKGTYMDITLLPTKEAKFGNEYMIVQSQTKEERLAKKEKIIIGSAKIVRRKSKPQSSPSPSGEYDSNPPGRPGGGDVRW